MNISEAFMSGPASANLQQAELTLKYLQETSVLYCQDFKRRTFKNLHLNSLGPFNT